MGESVAMVAHCTGHKQSCEANITPYEQRTKSFLIRNGRHGCRAPASYHKESLQLVNSQLSHPLKHHRVSVQFKLQSCLKGTKTYN